MEETPKEELNLADQLNTLLGNKPQTDPIKFWAEVGEMLAKHQREGN